MFDGFITENMYCSIKLFSFSMQETLIKFSLCWKKIEGIKLNLKKKEKNKYINHGSGIPLKNVHVQLTKSRYWWL